MFQMRSSCTIRNVKTTRPGSRGGRAIGRHSHGKDPADDETDAGTNRWSSRSANAAGANSRKRATCAGSSRNGKKQPHRRYKVRFGADLLPRKAQPEAPKSDPRSDSVCRIGGCQLNGDVRRKSEAMRLNEKDNRNILEAALRNTSRAVEKAARAARTRRVLSLLPRRSCPPARINTVSVICLVTAFFSPEAKTFRLCDLFLRSFRFRRPFRVSLFLSALRPPPPRRDRSPGPCPE